MGGFCIVFAENIKIPSHFVRDEEILFLIISANEFSISVRGDQLARMKLVIAENKSSAIEDGFTKLPYVFFGIINLPKIGGGKILLRAVKFRFFTLAKSAIFDSRACLHATAKNVASAKTNRVALAEIKRRHFRERLPSAFGTSAIISVVAVRADVVDRAREILGIGQGKDLILQLPRLFVDLCQNLFSCKHNAPPNRGVIILSYFLGIIKN